MNSKRVDIHISDGERTKHETHSSANSIETKYSVHINFDDI